MEHFQTLVCSYYWLMSSRKWNKQHFPFFFLPFSKWPQNDEWNIILSSLNLKFQLSEHKQIITPDNKTPFAHFKSNPITLQSTTYNPPKVEIYTKFKLYTFTTCQPSFYALIFSRACSSNFSIYIWSLNHLLSCTCFFYNLFFITYHATKCSQSIIHIYMFSFLHASYYWKF